MPNYGALVSICFFILQTDRTLKEHRRFIAFNTMVIRKRIVINKLKSRVSVTNTTA